MPVFPEVGSISTVSALISPAFSIAMTIAAPMRSFTLAAGLKYYSLARIVTCAPSAILPCRRWIEIFQLGQYRYVRAVRLRHFAQADDRGIADRIDDAVEN